MKRFHVHLNVADLATSVRFYSSLFAARPTVSKPDYAKWMLDEPRVNFAISATGRTPGIDHLGIQAETAEELSILGHQLSAAGYDVMPEDGAVCCYARSDKAWTEDPQGVRWESFHTQGEATTYYGGDAACTPDDAACAAPPAASPTTTAKAAAKAACCGPASACC